MAARFEAYQAVPPGPIKQPRKASIELSRDRRAWHGSGRGRWSTAGSSGCAPGWSRPSCSCTPRSSILIAFSFNDSRRNIVWQGFTLDYYAKAWHNASLIEAFANSIAIALIATAISTVIGALLALALWRFRFPGKPALEGAMALPIVIPEICMGVALLAFFVRTGWPSGLPWPLNLGPIVIGHVAFCFPFVAIVVRARMAGFDRALEEASKDLGAGEWQTFRRITLPYMKPGLLAGALLWR